MSKSYPSETKDVQVNQLSPDEKSMLVKQWVAMVGGFDEKRYKVAIGKSDNKEESQQMTLHCREIPSVVARGVGLSSTSSHRSQWAPNIGVNRRLAKLTAYRAPYDLLGVINSNLTVSHLCHNSQCFNPYHHSLETLECNKGRNWCPGPLGGCVHDPVCLMQGPQYMKGNGGIIGGDALGMESESLDSDIRI
jgi:hypothetical protein